MAGFHCSIVCDDCMIDITIIKPPSSHPRLSAANHLTNPRPSFAILDVSTPSPSEVGEGSFDGTVGDPEDAVEDAREGAAAASTPASRRKRRNKSASHPQCGTFIFLCIYLFFHLFLYLSILAYF